MVSEAQVLANRRNAAKSTGPRTRQGKAIVAQNALRHGLLSRQNVVAGEDQQEFDLHRAGILEELHPVGTIETLLAERIVGLAWRLVRAERLQNHAFDYLLARELDRSLDEFPDSLTAKEEQEMCGSHKSDPGLAVGRTLVKDCAKDRVLDRLMLCEQRIEGSLRRTMKDLRNFRADRQAESADGGPVRSVPVGACPIRLRSGQGSEPAEGASPPVSRASCLRSEGETPSTQTPCGTTTSEPDSAEQSQFPIGGPPHETDLEKQSQSPVGSGQSPPCGTDPAKQSQSDAAGGGHSPTYAGHGTDSAKQSQSAEKASCEPKPIGGRAG